MQKQTGIGIFLVGVGILLLLGQTGWFGERLILYFLAVGFFALYNFSGGPRNYGSIGFLIPSMVLLAIALFADLEEILEHWFLSPGWFFLFLAGAFLLIYLIHTRKAGKDWGSQNWPLFPAAGLGGFGLFVGLVTQMETWQESRFISYIVPLAFIGIGLYLTLYSRNRRQ